MPRPAHLLKANHFQPFEILSGFALYYIPSGASSGVWDTAWDLDGKNISHISFWNASPAPVPEPTTVLLLGLGLVGIAGLGRKRLMK